MGVTDEWDEDTGATDFEELQRSGGAHRRACLTILTGTLSGQLFKVSKGQLTIGRSPHVELRLDDDGISRNHARIRSETNRAWIEDMESRNGTFVNGERITGAVELKDGDKVQVGRGTVLRFGFQDQLDESFHESLLSSALRDGLTKLFNKRYLMDRLDSELKFAIRHETSLSLLLLDIDHFKKINDSFGHDVGDEVLREFAVRLASNVRAIDLPVRHGGEGFVVVMPDTDLEDARRIAERIRLHVAGAPFRVMGGQELLSVTISI
ncbi:MAG TPA: diguanylate cyclase, partial [Kofleriaceae bacterium]